MNNILITATGSLLASFFIASIPTLNEPPERVSERTEFATEYGRDNVYLKNKECFDVNRDFSNEDLNHFCRKVE